MQYLGPAGAPIIPHGSMLLHARASSAVHAFAHRGASIIVRVMRHASSPAERLLLLFLFARARSMLQCVRTGPDVREIIDANQEVRTPDDARFFIYWLTQTPIQAIPVTQSAFEFGVSIPGTVLSPRGPRVMHGLT